MPVQKLKFGFIFMGGYVPDYFFAGTSNFLKSSLVAWQLVCIALP